MERPPGFFSYLWRIGADRETVCLILQRTGWHGIPALAIALKEEKRKDFREDYNATVLGMIGKLLGGENWTLKTYVEIAYPEQIELDTRTPEEIKKDLVERLMQDDSV